MSRTSPPSRTIKISAVPIRDGFKPFNFNVYLDQPVSSEIEWYQLIRDKMIIYMDSSTITATAVICFNGRALSENYILKVFEKEGEER